MNRGRPWTSAPRLQLQVRGFFYNISLNSTSSVKWSQVLFPGITNNSVYPPTLKYLFRLCICSTVVYGVFSLMDGWNY